ncbi:MAG: methylmalonyl-CoA epimerase [candidate division Zixibacteria bacterium]|nr:methylmalonyl-CoA epimerase [candidate division Zixibacteria bacterium]
MSKPLVSHVGIAVANLQQAIDAYGPLLGDSSPTVTEVPDQGVKVAIFSGNSVVGRGRIELLAATSADSPIARFIKKRGEGLHHICIGVSDIEKTLASLKEAGVQLIDETPRVGAEGNRIAFVHPSGMNGVLIELEEESK